MSGPTTTFGQSSNSPFGFPSVFGQNSNAGSNPFTPKPFGSTTSYGSSPTGGSMFGGTPTGVFGANTSPAALTPAFGVSSTPGFGTPSSSFGGSSIFGQNPAFGGFTSSASAQNASSAANAPDIGASLPFGNGSTPTFGSLSASTFGSTASAFAGSSAPTLGLGAGGSFGASNTLGVANNSSFGVSNTSAFGASSSPAFPTSRFGFGATPIFGKSTSASGDSSLIGTAQSVFGCQNSPFGAPSVMPTNGTTGLGLSTFGVQHGGSRLASYSATKVEEYGDGRTKPVSVKLQSISAMPINKDKGHEEFRWEDYQLGDKGGLCPGGQSVGGIAIGGFSTLLNSFFPSPTLAQSSSLNSSNPFAPRTSSNPLAPPRTSSNPFAPPTSLNPFASQTPSNSSATHAPVNPFAPRATFPSSSGSLASSVPAFSSSLFNPLISANRFMATSSSRPSPFLAALSSTTSPFLMAASSSTSSPFVTASAPISASHLRPSISPVSGQSSSIRFIDSNSALGTATGCISGLSSSNTQPFSTSPSVAPSLMQTNALLAPNPLFGPSIAPSFSQPNINAPLTGSQLGVSSTAPLLSLSTSAGFSQTTPSFSTPFEPTQTAHTTGAFATSNIPKSSAGLGSFVGITGALGHNTCIQPSATQSNVNVQPVDRGSPFGDLPSMPHLSIGHSGATPSIRYGISSMPVHDKPAAPVRLSSFLTSRHLSQRRITLPVRKYDPKNDGPKVSFFNNDEEMLAIPKADALFVPRENPRALVILPAEQRPQRSKADKISPLVHAYENGDLFKNSTDKEGDCSIKSNHKPNNTHNSNFSLEGDSHVKVTGSEADEAAILKEHVAADVEALMPQLRHSEYYTEPQIEELAAKEKAEPGFCHRVKDFFVGRHGYGYIKFLGETDVQQLDLDSLVQFNNREVIVYMDESKKPPVGEGLNKPAEVTLLNIRCIDKKTGKQYMNGPRVDRYREMLIKKAAEQGAEFVSYDPVQGEWKFKVQHFSRYEFTDDSK